MATLEEALSDIPMAFCVGLPPWPERFCTGLLGMLALHLGDTRHVTQDHCSGLFPPLLHLYGLDFNEDSVA